MRTLGIPVSDELPRLVELRINSTIAVWGRTDMLRRDLEILVVDSFMSHLKHADEAFSDAQLWRPWSLTVGEIR